MEWFDRNADVPGGGRARGSGGCYHLSFRSGSRAGGSCARSAHAYITRTDEYDDAERDEAVYIESDRMPSWTEGDAAAYWDGADVYERANGRLYVSADFALPRELSADDQIGLAHSFAQDLTADQHLPYTLAIHAAQDVEDGAERVSTFSLVAVSDGREGSRRGEQSEAAGLCGSARTPDPGLPPIVTDTAPQRVYTPCSSTGIAV